ncbi:MAG: Gfo/Idh/MocA family protein [Lachnospiraceae bacterium]
MKKTFDKMKTAIVGCGMISQAYLDTLTQKFSIINVTACCDLNEAKAKETAEKYNLSVMTIEEILEDSSIELVINLTTSPVHYNIIKMLLEADKHVYTEKILSIELEEAKELVELADKKGKYLGVAPDTFLGAAIQTAKYAVDSGMIGEVTSCYGVLTRNQLLSSAIFSSSLKNGSGIGFDVGIYYVTAFLNIIGPVKTVTGFMETRNPIRAGQFISNYGEELKVESENLVAGSMQFANGAMGNLLFDSNSVFIIPERPAIAINGTLGTLYLNDPNTFGGDVRVLLFGEKEERILPQCHPFADECRGLGAAEMAWSIRLGRKNRASKELGYHALEVLHGIKISGNTRQFYDMKSEFEMPEPLARGYHTGFPIPMIEESVIAF